MQQSLLHRLWQEQLRGQWLFLMGYAQTIISALLFLPFFFQYANAQNIEQHRNLLSSVDLEDREYPVLSERLLLTQMEIVPSCRKNFSHEKCNNTAHQFIQGPITRSFYLPETEFGFLSNTLANRFHNATTLSEWNSVHKYCSENTIEKFHRWMASTSETDFEEYIYVTYLSPNDPWFYCFSRDNRNAATNFDNFGIFELEHYEFWLWKGGRVIGEVECDTLYNRFGDSLVSPQCIVNLHFSDGRYRMSFGPLPSTNIRQIFLNLTPITHNFWDRSGLDALPHGIVPELFYSIPIISPNAEQIITMIERETQ